MHSHSPETKVLLCNFLLFVAGSVPLVRAVLDALEVMIFDSMPLYLRATLQKQQGCSPWERWNSGTYLRMPPEIKFLNESLNSNFLRDPSDSSARAPKSPRYSTIASIFISPWNITSPCTNLVSSSGAAD
jgi:hypothetical protein